jgi:glycosyltransferase involved in cell wall biosynthesis
MASVLSSNSESEMARIRHDFPETVKARSVVVANSVDPTVFNADISAAAPEFTDCILSVGRIERRKCQLQLVRAVKGTGLRLLLVETGRENGLLSRNIDRFPIRTSTVAGGSGFGRHPGAARLSREMCAIA